jgi:NADH:ubiquinone oxidoreductase subunit D
MYRRAYVQKGVRTEGCMYRRAYVQKGGVQENLLSKYLEEIRRHNQYFLSEVLTIRTDLCTVCMGGTE